MYRWCSGSASDSEFHEPESGGFKSWAGHNFFFSFKPFVCVIYFIIVLFVVGFFFSPILFSCGDSITYTRRDHYYQTPCRSIERIEHMTSNCDVTI